MREVIFDTETTGFGVEEHRVVEIGCVELVNRLPTGKVFHTYVNPERAIDPDAIRVHGITDEKVKGAPRFAEVAGDLMAFFADSPLVAHNAEFDFTFINSELKRCGLAALTNEMRCSLVLAKSKLPGQRHNLDALCRYFNVDNSARTYHGALLDAQLLADVYVELTGGLQGAMRLEAGAAKMDTAVENAVAVAASRKVIEATEAERAAHAAFVAKMVPGSRWE